MLKILFLIHDLGHGGAEKVLVNLVNNMDPTQFDITVMALFGGGVNEQFLAPHIHYRAIYPKAMPGNSHMMKLLTPKQLHRMYIKEHYDIEISYLEGPCARIISGCTDPTTKKVCWIHIEQRTEKRAAGSFRSYREAMDCYNAFDRIICVSDTVRKDFMGLLPVKVPTEVLYNTNESTKIMALAQEPVEDGLFPAEEWKLVGVGKLLKSIHSADGTYQSYVVQKAGSSSNRGDGEKVAVGVDLKDGFVAIKGWTETSALTADAFFTQMEAIGVKTVICTDISRDGAMKGTNRQLYRELSEQFSIDLIASGGVSSLDDIAALKAMGLHGAIIGKAYYTGAINLAEALEVAR